MNDVYLQWCHGNGIDVTHCVADAVRRTFPGKYSLHDILTGMDKAYRALDAARKQVVESEHG